MSSFSFSKLVQLDTRLQVTLCLVNWTCPCIYRTEAQTTQTLVLAHVLQQDPQRALGLVLQPVFSYRKNAIFLTEAALVKSLMQQSLSAERVFSVIFASKTAGCLVHCSSVFGYARSASAPCCLSKRY